MDLRDASKEVCLSYLERRGSAIALNDSVHFLRTFATVTESDTAATTSQGWWLHGPSFQGLHPKNSLAVTDRLGEKAGVHLTG